MATTLKPPTRTDEAIRSDVLAELEMGPQNQISRRRDSVVTLSGYVPSYWEKDAAEKAAKRVYRVKGVANDIEITLSSMRSDPEIAREAVQELERHVSIGP